VSSFLVASSYSILAANVTRMSLTCHEEIGRVGRVGQDATKTLTTYCNKSCVSCWWTLENDKTHGQTGSTIHRSRPPADQSGQRVASWTGKSPVTPDMRDILVASPRGCRACRACQRGCLEDATMKLLPWNLNFFTGRVSRTGTAVATVCLFLLYI